MRFRVAAVSGWIAAVAVAVMASVSGPTPVFAQDGDMSWQFSEFNDPENKGALTSRLVYGVPETDNVQVAGVCDGRPSTGVKFSNFTFGTATGNLREGAAADLSFSGGGFSRVLKGAVYGTQAEVGVSGVNLDIEHTDPIWDALLTNEALDYLVPGYGANRLELLDGREKIRGFIEACRDYADAILGKTASAEPEATVIRTGSGISEQEAFNSAKELGTIEAWEAFLTNFPTGFRADLARAYVNRLATSGGGNQAPPRAVGNAAPPAPATPPHAVPRPVVAQPLPTLNLGPGYESWQTGNRTLAMSNGRSGYTASVHANGVELITFCLNYNQSGGVGYALGAIVKKSPRGQYPDYIARINQGLAAAPTYANSTLKQIQMSFSNGASVTLASANPALIGDELAVGTIGQGFAQESPDLENILSQQSMTIAAPPFAATFQLTGSRGAVCDVMNRCGASVPGCRGSSAVTPAAASNTGGSSCSGGQYYSKSAGGCRCPSSKPEWDGSRCVARQQLQCGQNYTLSNGKCVLIQNCGKNAYRSPEGDCYCKANYEMRNGRCQWKTDKQGFEVAPWKKPGCKSLDNKCKQGNGQACMKYEERCQVN